MMSGHCETEIRGVCLLLSNNRLVVFVGTVIVECSVGRVLKRMGSGSVPGWRRFCHRWGPKNERVGSYGGRY